MITSSIPSQSCVGSETCWANPKDWRGSLNLFVLASSGSGSGCWYRPWQVNRMMTTVQGTWWVPQRIPMSVASIRVCRVRRGPWMCHRSWRGSTCVRMWTGRVSSTSWRHVCLVCWWPLYRHGIWNWRHLYRYKQEWALQSRWHSYQRIGVAWSLSNPSLHAIYDDLVFAIRFRYQLTLFSIGIHIAMSTLSCSYCIWNRYFQNHRSIMPNFLLFAWFDTVELNRLPCLNNKMYDDVVFADRFWYQLAIFRIRLLIGLYRLHHAHIAYEIDSYKIITAFCWISYCLYDLIRLNSFAYCIQTTRCSTM